MLREQIIEPGTLTVGDGRVSVSVRMPWYRALPLASVTDLGLAVDGVAADELTWTVEGRTFAAEDLGHRHDEWWYVLDSAVLSGRLDLPDPPGHHTADHRVDVTLGLYIPYIPTPGGALKIVEHDSKTLPATAARARTETPR